METLAVSVVDLQDGGCVSVYPTYSTYSTYLAYCYEKMAIMTIIVIMAIMPLMAIIENPMTITMAILTIIA